MSVLNNDIMYLPGVGPKRAEILQSELGIFTFGDLLGHFPYRYVDRTKFYRIGEVHSGLPYIQVRGKFSSLEVVKGKGRNRLSGIFSDGTGVLELVWFQGFKWIKQSIKHDCEYIVFGKPGKYGNIVNI
ncbi:MAG: ATP-dependent DNA helicase RecG, partial [Bacteroidetes bacterium]|nr:ATP-dependent DNA helicase RecG [Bacteroidota bacterium]